MYALMIVCRQMNEAFKMSHGAIEKEIRGTWASVCFLGNANWVGFTPGDDASHVLPAAVAQNEQLAEVVLQVTCRLCFSSLTSAMTWSHKLPGCFCSRGQQDTN